MFQNYESLWKAFIRPARQIYSHHDLGPPKLIFKGCSVIRNDIDLKKSNGSILKCSLFQPILNNLPPNSSPSKELSQYPCVVYCHGNSGCRIDSIAYIEQFASKGIALFAFDFLGSGISDGEYVSLGYHEQNDLVEVFSYLRQLPQISAIGIFGRSMGAVSALLYVSKDSNIQCLVLDSPFANLKSLALEIAEQKVSLPQFLLEGILSFINNSIFDRAGFRLEQVDPSKVVSAIEIPALFLASNEDTFVKAEHSQRLQKLYKGDSQLKLISGDHNSIRDSNCKEFVADFFAEHFESKHFCQRQQLSNFNRSVSTSQLSSNFKDQRQEIFPIFKNDYRNSSLLQKRRLPLCHSLSYQLTNICKQQDFSQTSDQVSSSSQTTTATNGQIHGISPLSPIENEGLCRIRQLQSEQMNIRPFANYERIQINNQPQVTKEPRSASENVSSSFTPANNKTTKQFFPLFSNSSNNKNFNHLKSSIFSSRNEKKQEDIPILLHRNPFIASNLFQKSHLRKLSPKKQRTLKHFLVPSSTENQKNQLALQKESPSTMDASFIQSERISTMMSINDEFQEFDGPKQQQQEQEKQIIIPIKNSIHYQKSYPQAQGLQKDEEVFQITPHLVRETNKNCLQTFQPPRGEQLEAGSREQTPQQFYKIISPFSSQNRNIIPSLFSPPPPPPPLDLQDDLVPSSSYNKVNPNMLSHSTHNKSLIQYQQASSKIGASNQIFEFKYNLVQNQTEGEQLSTAIESSQEPSSSASSRREKRIISLQNYVSAKPSQTSNQQQLDQPKHTRQASAVVQSTSSMENNTQKQSYFNHYITKQSSINIASCSNQTNRNNSNTNALIQSSKSAHQKTQSLDLNHINFPGNIISANNPNTPNYTVQLLNEQGNSSQNDKQSSISSTIPQEQQQAQVVTIKYQPREFNQQLPRTSSLFKHAEIYQTQQYQNSFLTTTSSENTRNVLEIFPQSKQHTSASTTTSTKTMGLRIPQLLEKSFSQIPTAASQPSDITLLSQTCIPSNNATNMANYQQESIFSSPARTLTQAYHNKQIFSLNYNNSITPNQSKTINQMNSSSCTPISFNHTKNTIVSEFTQLSKQEVFPIKQQIQNPHQGQQQLQQSQSQQQQQQQQHKNNQQFQNINQQSQWQSYQPSMFQAKTAIFKETKQSINLISQRPYCQATHRPSQSMQLQAGKHF